MATKLKSDVPPFYQSPAQAADYMNISRSTLARWHKKGLISCVRIGGRTVRYRRSDLDAMMKSHLCKVCISEE